MPLDQPAARRGRPSRVTLEQISGIVGRIPPGELSMARVAEELGVSASGLYHHVKGREQLLEIAAVAAVEDLLSPADTGQHWSQWWFDYCVMMRQALLLHPDVLRRVRGSHPGLVTRLEAMLSVMDRSGFATDEALTAIDTITNWLYGFVWREVEVQTETEAGRPPDLELIKTLRQKPSEPLPYLRKFVRDTHVPDPETEFVAQLSTIISGVAARRGETISSFPNSKRRDSV